MKDYLERLGMSSYRQAADGRLVYVSFARRALYTGPLSEMRRIARWNVPVLFGAVWLVAIAVGLTDLPILPAMLVGGALGGFAGLLFDLYVASRLSRTGLTKADLVPVPRRQRFGKHMRAVGPVVSWAGLVLFLVMAVGGGFMAHADGDRFMWVFAGLMGLVAAVYAMGIYYARTLTPENQDS